VWISHVYSWYFFAELNNCVSPYTTTTFVDITRNGNEENRNQLPNPLEYYSWNLKGLKMAHQYDLFQSYCDDDVINAVVNVLERESWWIKGPEIEELEQQISGVTDAEHAIAVSSGTAALYATLESMGIEGKEVIIPSFTYQATPNAIVAGGGKPVFADIESITFGLRADDVRQRITDETVGIVPVHFAGTTAAEIRELRDVADEHDLFLVEDAAHSLGATSAGKPVGSFGDAAIFSFAFNKIITTGQGGIVVTDDSDLAKKIRQFRVHGRNSNREYVTWGLNLVMSSIHAAIGVAQLSKLDEFIATRRRLVNRYNKSLSSIDGIRTPTAPPDGRSVHFLYNILLRTRSQRNELQTFLDEQGIPTQVYYRGCHLTEYYSREWGYQAGDLPLTEEIADRIITLPLYVNLETEDIDHISDTVRSFFRTSR
jgi:perosamine synthetase